MSIKSRIEALEARARVMPVEQPTKAERDAAHAALEASVLPVARIVNSLDELDRHLKTIFTHEDDGGVIDLEARQRNEVARKVFGRVVWDKVQSERSDFPAAG